MNDWNPELYLKFKKQRTQPAIDLISKIRCKKPKRILDIGSGPGNSSNELKKKWRHAEVIGIDNSKTMIAKAEKSYPKITFLMKDAAEDLDDLGMFDIIFSNAAVQWISGIDRLLPYWFSLLKPGGVLAFQIPNPTDMTIHKAVKTVAAMNVWLNKFDAFFDGLHLHEPLYYYNILSRYSGFCDLWETHYYHIMPNHESLIEWYSSTGMKPYLDKLNEEEIVIFRGLVRELIKKDYKVAVDGLVLFPFRRIFFTKIKVVNQ